MAYTHNKATSFTKVVLTIVIHVYVLLWDYWWFCDGLRNFKKSERLKCYTEKGQLRYSEKI